MGKPSGLRTARKHVKNRRSQVWADLDYKKAHLGTRWKANPFGGASHAKGIVLEKVIDRKFYSLVFSSRSFVLSINFVANHMPKSDLYSMFFGMIRCISF